MKRIVCLLVLSFVPSFVGDAFSVSNDEIADQALSSITTWTDSRTGYGNRYYPVSENDLSGYCKWWVQVVVLAPLGISLGSGYTDCYEEVGYEAALANVVRGDVGQINQANGSKGYIAGMHTFIVLERNSNGSLWVVDSNYLWDRTPRVHDQYRPWNNEDVKSGVLKVHFYRLGELVVSLPSTTRPLIARCVDGDGRSKAYSSGFAKNALFVVGDSGWHPLIRGEAWRACLARLGWPADKASTPLTRAQMDGVDSDMLFFDLFLY
ncbi:hypothetical protein HQ544_03095 [Candidatus Falkowbacteria bacterium]|nr:hypothetical protein [Candidatus Falkowbacteria bacterium]